MTLLINPASDASVGDSSKRSSSAATAERFIITMSASSRHAILSSFCVFIFSSMSFLISSPKELRKRLNIA